MGSSGIFPLLVLKWVQAVQGSIPLFFQKTGKESESLAKIETINEVITTPEFNIMDFIRIDNYQGEAEAIAKLYCKTYNIKAENMLTQLSYPYPEALDPAWINDKARSRNVIWKVVTDTRYDSVVGSGTVLLDRENQRAYVRGVMIDPEYQKYKIGSKVLVNTFREIIQNYRDVIKIFWSESRTAHSGSQKIAEDSGFFPVGFLPNKDIFLEKRESDLLLVLYAMNALKMRRRNPQIIPEVLPVYEVIAKQYRLEPIVPVVVPPIHRNGHQVKPYCKVDRYGYHHHIFCAYGEKLKLKVNPRTQVAEEASFSPDIEPVILNALVGKALASLGHLYYVEFYASAYRPAIQRVFADLGFKATGYIPGWDLVDGQREDAIIMSRVKEYPPLSNMDLTDKSKRLVNAVLNSTFLKESSTYP
jgi:RimJ/RimL family protein N-acetyltransferase